MTSHLRQQDLVDGKKLAATSVTIIGAGAVGSFTALALAKMGVQDLTVYDHDLIEEHNLPNQFYRTLDLGLLKVEALEGMIHEHTGVTIKSEGVKYQDQPLSGVVIACPDNMQARKTVWRRVKRNVQVELFIDARMGAEVGRLYSIRPLEDAEFYQETLYDSKEAIQEPCTRRTIIYTVLGIAAFICAQVKKHVQNEPLKKEVVVDWKLGMILS